MTWMGVHSIGAACRHGFAVSFCDASSRLTRDGGGPGGCVLSLLPWAGAADERSMAKASQRGGAAAHARPGPQARRSFSERARRAALLHTRGPLAHADRRADRGRSEDDLGLEAPPTLAPRTRSLARARRDAAGGDPAAAQARTARGDDPGLRPAAAADG